MGPARVRAKKRDCEQRDRCETDAGPTPLARRHREHGAPAESTVSVKEISAQAAMAKYWISELQNRVIDDCLQLHGAYGYTNEFRIGRMYRDARVSRIYGGSNEIMKVLVARSL